MSWAKKYTAVGFSTEQSKVPANGIGLFHQ